jgi:dephospho-CoA kinase
VVLDVPLLAEVGRDRYPVAGVLVVDAPVGLAVDRLVSARGFTEADARARVAAQASREQRLAIADLVLDNSGDEVHLRSEVERAWAWIQALRPPLRGAARALVVPPHP